MPLRKGSPNIIEREPKQIAPPQVERVAPQDHETGPDLRDTTQEAKKKPFTRREQEWYDYFSNRFGPICIMILWFAMPFEKASFYAPNPEECKAIAPHMARIVPRIEDHLSKILHLPSWVHDIAVTSDSSIQIGFIAMGYLDRIGVLDKVAPYVTRTFSRMGNYGQQSARPSQDVPGNRTEEPIDLSRVNGLFSQWAP